MQSFLQEYLQQHQESARFLVRERKVYKIENARTNHSDINMKELATFYHFCGNYNFYQYQPNLLMDQLRRQYHRQILPYHNAVAFFQAFMDYDPTERQKCCQQLKSLLPYALSCRGYVFGTSFYIDGMYCLHPCDLDFTDLVCTDLGGREEIYENVLRSQAELRTGHSFIPEKNFYVRIVFNILREKELIERWLEEAKREENVATSRENDDSAPWNGDINKAEEMFEAFLEFYSQYCISQVSDKNLCTRNQIETDLDILKMAAHTVFKLEHMLRSLDSIKEIQSRDENIIAKRDWLNEFQNVLISEDMQSGIDAILETMGVSKGAPELYDYISNKKAFSKRTLEYYPVLNKESPLYKLGKQEGKELRWYRKSGVASVIDWLYRGPRKKSIRKVMPFYLLDFFANDLKPLRPFKRKPYDFHPDKLKFQGEISFCSHPDVIRKQESHHFLYQALLDWCRCYFDKVYDRPLCNALYTFYRRHLVCQQPSDKTNYLRNDFSVLKGALWKVFDMPPSVFPQRSKMEISVNEFFEFYYYNTTPDVIAVRKILRTIVTNADADEYKKLAFLDAHGFGYSFHPNEWYEKIENFLSGITSRDKAILQYIDSDHPDATIHIGQVDLAIQFICCQKIQEAMTKDVLRFCKQVFSPNCQ